MIEERSTTKQIPTFSIDFCQVSLSCPEEDSKQPFLVGGDDWISLDTRLCAAETVA